MHDEQELDRLRRFSTRPGPRFGLAIAICADMVLAEQHRAALTKLVDKRIATVEFQHEDERSDLVQPIMDAAANADVVFVVGLDRLVTDSFGRTRNAPAVANLNQRRDELPELLDARVVFWVAKSAYPSLSEVAWDLCQVMLTTAEFEATRTQSFAPRPAASLPEWMELADEREAPALERQLVTLAEIHANATTAISRSELAESASAINIRLGRPTQAVTWLERAVAAAIEAEQPREAARQHRRLAQLRMFVGDLDGAIQDVDHAARLGDSPQQIALADMLRADIAIQRLDFDAALELLRERCLPAFERARDRAATAQVWDKIATIHELRGELDQAIAVREEQQLPLYGQLEDPRGEAVALEKIAGSLARQGQLESARKLINQRVLPALEGIDDAVAHQSAMAQLADVIEDQGDRREATRVRKLAARPGSTPNARAATLSLEANDLTDAGRSQDALTLWREQILPIHVELGDLRSQVVAHLEIARALAATGRTAEALSVLERQVLPSTERVGDAHGRAAALELAAQLRRTLQQLRRRRWMIGAGVALAVFAVVAVLAFVL
ncbi:hypothetical protein [Enhygromyxa salina]|uniref:Tetratricopeptide repeat protein n=1 Tax=Enhygromyxa salina TaxID=215803 RepID=A0A2S9YMI9_9BACT|nr:hypothetical protein [Enhygromyxa salina]PRQ06303.1 Tetratricopeptide repeat protein [Enhygromyxa salina]